MRTNVMTGEATADAVVPADNRLSLRLADYLWCALLLGGYGVVYARFSEYLNGYEWVIFTCLTLVLGYAGIAWSELRRLLLIVATLALFSIHLYDANLSLAEEHFLLQYFLAS
ncbi:MAG: hypothetical protein OXN26_03455, partial [Gammaproteobacteria bacterium]|nr:hypothetical protein [Gammaproteobacteria bacterium]